MVFFGDFAIRIEQDSMHEQSRFFWGVLGGFGGLDLYASLSEVGRYDMTLLSSVYLQTT